jgi:phosphate transport system ATP-binding protein
MEGFTMAVMTKSKKSFTNHTNIPTLVPNQSKKNVAFKTQDLNLWYGEDHALKSINLDIYENEVTAIIGPSGCGKSTFIKTLNRMVELIPVVKVSGDILYREKSILDKAYKVEDLRTHVGMVFQKPNPFPKSIYENIAYGPKIHGIRNKKILDEIVEKSLRGAAIWDEVKDRLHENAYGLSGGQQQRICIARCLAIEPDVILMDEPTSALDPISTLKIEELVQELKKDYSIIIVTHNMQQAARISDKTAFFLNGEVIEFDDTNKIFSNPSDKRTEDYITGRFG